MSEKIILEWGKAGIGQPPNEREIANTIEEMKEKASKSNVFAINLSENMLSYVKERLEDSVAIKTIRRVNDGRYWVVVGIDEKTAQNAYDKI